MTRCIATPVTDKGWNQSERHLPIAEAKRAYVAAWLQEHGTEDQIERFVAGVLPEVEYLEVMRDEAFAPLDDAGHRVGGGDTDAPKGEQRRRRQRGFFLEKKEIKGREKGLRRALQQRSPE